MSATHLVKCAECKGVVRDADGRPITSVRPRLTALCPSCDHSVLPVPWSEDFRHELAYAAELEPDSDLDDYPDDYPDEEP